METLSHRRCVRISIFIARHGDSFPKITSISYKISLTEASLGWSCLCRCLKEDNKILFIPKNKYVRDFIKKTVPGGRVLNCNRNLLSKSSKEVVNTLKKYYSVGLQMSMLFGGSFKHINTFINYYVKKYQSKFSERRRNNIEKIEECIDNKLAKIPISKEKSMVDKTVLSSEYNSLYTSAMAHRDSKWPKLETVKAIIIEDNEKICSLFIRGGWKNLNKSGFFKVKNQNSKVFFSTYEC